MLNLMKGIEMNHEELKKICDFVNENDDSVVYYFLDCDDFKGWVEVDIDVEEKTWSTKYDHMKGQGCFNDLDSSHFHEFKFYKKVSL